MLSYGYAWAFPIIHLKSFPKSLVKRIYGLLQAEIWKKARIVYSLINECSSFYSLVLCPILKLDLWRGNLLIHKEPYCNLFNLQILFITFHPTTSRKPQLSCEPCCICGIPYVTASFSLSKTESLAYMYLKGSKI